MRNKSLALMAAFIIFGSWILAASPWANISYAEGKTFLLIRDGKTVTWSVADPAVFGMVIRQGDIIQTAAATFLELSINSVSASVQIAENTSFKCDADTGGSKVTGELYYGRVRAKVAKLAGASSFRISTPSLVAGVRGTDFGCDVIAARSSTPAASTPLLNRVFCFEGTVSVSPSAAAGAAAQDTAATPVLISKNEMVEKIVTDQAAPVTVEPLKKDTLSGEVNKFWGSRPFAEPAAMVLPDGTSRHAWPAGRVEKPSLRNLKIPAIAATALLLAGTVACAGSAWFSSNVDSNAVLVDPSFSAGLVMASSGSLLALISTLFD